MEENHPIDINKYTNYVHAPQCGAIATFYGNTRDTFEGKTVIELRYEAYVPMAIRCLKSICSSARSKWNLNSVAVAHRLGPVAVGETSVFVAVSSVHRVDALDACKFVIDEIKASVPIWKKEVYSNGEVWKENMEFLERIGENGDFKRGCCKPKVKVEGDDVAGHVKRGCCREKVKVEDDAWLDGMGSFLPAATPSGKFTAGELHAVVANFASGKLQQRFLAIGKIEFSRQEWRSPQKSTPQKNGGVRRRMEESAEEHPAEEWWSPQKNEQSAEEKMVVRSTEGHSAEVPSAES
ncbi:hypothetical protein LXL04_002857 [Taraxacum kok-saghyz]